MEASGWADYVSTAKVAA